MRPSGSDLLYRASSTGAVGPVGPDRPRACGAPDVDWLAGPRILEGFGAQVLPAVAPLTGTGAHPAAEPAADIAKDP
ncbi:hypothetical protein GCM10023169_15910 [Georgenia halophila]|uniref:Uncharacterized protein n=1 Tax=Georgenia halophila TaxID=620889 RepID=A0ABP8L5J6_9MICO